jgi:hypothetical protein
LCCRVPAFKPCAQHGVSLLWLLLLLLVLADLDDLSGQPPARVGQPAGLQRTTQQRNCAQPRLQQVRKQLGLLLMVGGGGGARKGAGCFRLGALGPPGPGRGWTVHPCRSLDGFILCSTCVTSPSPAIKHNWHHKDAGNIFIFVALHTQPMAAPVRGLNPKRSTRKRTLQVPDTFQG